MSIINNRLQLLRPYLTEIKFGESITLLTGEFYPKWIIKEQGDRVKIHKSGDTDKGRVMYNFYGENGNVNVDDLIDYFLEVSNNRKYPIIVDNNEPDKTPILTPSIY